MKIFHSPKSGSKYSYMLNVCTACCYFPVYCSSSWKNFTVTCLNRMKSCYHKCIKKFFGFARMESMTQILIMLRLSSFDTVLHNANSSFHKQCHNTSNCLIHYLLRRFDVSMWCLATKWMDGWLHFSLFILVFLSMFLHVCVCVCVLLCLSVRLSWSAIHVSFVGLDIVVKFLCIFWVCFCAVSVCVLFFFLWAMLLEYNKWWWWWWWWCLLHRV